MDIYGQTSGLKTSERKRLESLYDRKTNQNLIISTELAKTLSQLSNDIGKSVSLLLSRNGKIIAVAVGDAKEMPIPQVHLVEQRLTGFRLVHTHLEKEATLSENDLSKLFMHRLDFIAAIEVRSGLPHAMEFALMSPPQGLHEDWQIYPSKPFYDYSQFKIAETVQALEDELSRYSKRLELKDGAGERVVIAGVDSGQGTLAETALAELLELARTAGGVVAHHELVYKNTLDSKYALGRGKIEELISQAYHQNANTLIMGIDLTPTQARELEALSTLKILDRTQLILDIFAGHARTPEAKTQVELAQLNYLLPRLVGKGKELSKLGGGIGTRGPGETKLEQDRRKLYARIDELRDKLKNYSKRREQARSRRDKSKTPIIAVVGYTNAGKTTLMQVLAKAGDPGENKLFATLKPLTRKGFIHALGEVIYSDTVGFIRQMPETLMEAFRSTLEELQDADVLLHVVDTSQEGYLERIKVVERILAELDIEAPQVMVCTKSDVSTPFDRNTLRETHNALWVSAVTKSGIDQLKEALAYTLMQNGHQGQRWAQYGNLEDRQDLN